MTNSTAGGKSKKKSVINNNLMENSLKPTQPKTPKIKKKNYTKVNEREWEAARRRRFNDEIEKLRTALPNCDPCSKVEVIQRARAFVQEQRARESLNSEEQTKEFQSLKTQIKVFQHVMREAGIEVSISDQNKASYSLPSVCQDGCCDGKKRRHLINFSETKFGIDAIDSSSTPVERLNKEVQTEVASLGHNKIVNASLSHSSNVRGCAEVLRHTDSSLNLEKRICKLPQSESQSCLVLGKDCSSISRMSSPSKSSLVQAIVDCNSSMTDNTTSDVGTLPCKKAMLVPEKIPSTTQMMEKNNCVLPNEIDANKLIHSNDLRLEGKSRIEKNVSVPPALNAVCCSASPERSKVYLPMLGGGSYITFVTSSMCNTPIMSTGIPGIFSQKSLFQINPLQFINLRPANTANLKRIAPKITNETEKCDASSISSKPNEVLKLQTRVQYKRKKISKDNLIPQLRNASSKKQDSDHPSLSCKSRSKPKDFALPISSEDPSDIVNSTAVVELDDNLLNLSTEGPRIVSSEPSCTSSENVLTEILPSIDNEDRLSPILTPSVEVSESTSQFTSKIQNPISTETERSKSLCSSSTKSKSGDSSKSHDIESSSSNTDYSIMSLCLSSKIDDCSDSGQAPEQVVTLQEKISTNAFIPVNTIPSSKNTNNDGKTSVSFSTSSTHRLDSSVPVPLSEPLALPSSPSKSVLSPPSVSESCSYFTLVGTEPENNRTGVNTSFVNSQVLNLTEVPVHSTQSDSANITSLPSKTNLSINSILISDFNHNSKGQSDQTSSAGSTFVSSSSNLVSSLYLHKPSFPVPSPVTSMSFANRLVKFQPSLENNLSSSGMSVASSFSTSSKVSSIPLKKISSVSKTNTETVSNSNSSSTLDTEYTNASKVSRSEALLPVLRSQNIPILTTSSSNQKMLSTVSLSSTSTLSSVTSECTPSVTKSVFSIPPMSYGHPFPFCGLPLSDAPTTFSFTLTKTSFSSPFVSNLSGKEAKENNYNLDLPVSLKGSQNAVDALDSVTHAQRLWDTQHKKVSSKNPTCSSTFTPWSAINMTKSTMSSSVSSFLLPSCKSSVTYTTNVQLQNSVNSSYVQPKHSTVLPISFDNSTSDKSTGSTNGPIASIGFGSSNSITANFELSSSLANPGWYEQKTLSLLPKSNEPLSLSTDILSNSSESDVNQFSFPVSDSSKVERSQVCSSVPSSNSSFNHSIFSLSKMSETHDKVVSTQHCSSSSRAPFFSVSELSSASNSASTKVNLSCPTSSYSIFGNSSSYSSVRSVSSPEYLSLKMSTVTSDKILTKEKSEDSISISATVPVSSSDDKIVACELVEITKEELPLTPVEIDKKVPPHQDKPLDFRYSSSNKNVSSRSTTGDSVNTIASSVSTTGVCITSISNKGAMGDLSLFTEINQEPATTKTLLSLKTTDLTTSASICASLDEDTSWLIGNSATTTNSMQESAKNPSINDCVDSEQAIPLSTSVDTKSNDDLQFSSIVSCSISSSITVSKGNDHAVHDEKHQQIDKTLTKISTVDSIPSNKQAQAHISMNESFPLLSTKELDLGKITKSEKTKDGLSKHLESFQVSSVQTEVSIFKSQNKRGNVSAQPANNKKSDPTLRDSKENLKTSNETPEIFSSSVHSKHITQSMSNQPYTSITNVVSTASDEQCRIKSSSYNIPPLESLFLTSTYDYNQPSSVQQQPANSYYVNSQEANNLAPKINSHSSVVSKKENSSQQSSQIFPNIAIQPQQNEVDEKSQSENQGPFSVPSYLQTQPIYSIQQNVYTHQNTTTSNNFGAIVDYTPERISKIQSETHVEQHSISQQGHSSLIEPSNSYNYFSDYNYCKKNSNLPRPEMKHNFYNCKQSGAAYSYDTLADSSTVPGSLMPPCAENADDLSVKILDGSSSDPVRNFSVSHLVSPYVEGRRYSGATLPINRDQGQQRNVVTDEKAKETSSKNKSSVRKKESKVGNPNSTKAVTSTCEAKRRSPARSGNSQLSTNPTNTWNKHFIQKQANSYSAEALISSQSYGRPNNRHNFNQNYHFMSSNQMYSGSYPTPQTKNYAQNNSFPYGCHDRTGSCGADYNIQFHTQPPGSLSYSHNMAYVPHNYPYQNLPSSSHAFIPGEFIPPTHHHSGSYARIHDINHDHSNFTSNASFTFPFEPQDMNGGPSFTSANVANMVGRSDQSSVNPKMTQNKSQPVTGSSSSNLQATTPSKRTRYAADNSMTPGIGTAANFLDASALSHISLHSFTPPSEDPSLMHSNFVPSAPLHQNSNFIFGSDNFMPIHSHHHHHPTVPGSGGIASNLSTSFASTNSLALNASPAAAAGLDNSSNSQTNRNIPSSIPFHSSSVSVAPNTLLKTPERQINQSSMPIPSHFSSSLANFNLTSIIPEIDGKADDEEVDSSSLSGKALVLGSCPDYNLPVVMSKHLKSSATPSGVTMASNEQKSELLSSSTSIRAPLNRFSATGDGGIVGNSDGHNQQLRMNSNSSNLPLLTSPMVGMNFSPSGQ